MSSRQLMSVASSFRGNRGWRGALLLAIVAIHLLLLLLLARHLPGERVERPMTMNVFTMPMLDASAASAQANPERAPPPSPSVTTTVAARPLIDADPAPPPLGPGDITISAPRASTGDGGCTLDQAIAEAIRQDTAAMSEIEALPSDVRTPADAILLWNGRWLDTGSTSVKTNAISLRHAVERVIAAASLGCRDAASTGPHFIAVPAGNRTMTIVIGSGTWRWADLVAPVDDCPSNAAVACSQTRVATDADRTASP